MCQKRKVSELESVRTNFSDTFQSEQFLTLSNSDTFQSQPFLTFSNSDTFKSQPFLTFSIYDTFQSKKGSDTFQF